MEEVGMMNNFNKFNSSEELTQNLAQNIASILQDAIEKDGKATLLVSGGNTPKLFFQKLSNIDITWKKVTIGLVDERWVDTNLKDSNEFLVRENLLINYASKANFVGLYKKETNLIVAEKVCSKLYEKEFDKIDLLILGMGTDGHTASLFPNNEKLSEAYDLVNPNFCISIEPENVPYTRMSLTLKKILDAKNIILHIEGDEKLEVYNRALKSSDIYKYPISAVIKEARKDIEVYYS
jgi:6-phosphogluconolactonase